MIQRIQTLYYLIANFLVILLFFVPFAEMADSNGIVYQVGVTGVLKNEAKMSILETSWMILLTTCVIMIFQSLVIFLYKNRLRQIRLSYVIITLLIILTFLFKFWQGFDTVKSISSWKIYAVFPAIAMVLNLLAINGIKKDENLIKSIDRIR
jgi:hypothetical protein